MAEGPGLAWAALEVWVWGVVRGWASAEESDVGVGRRLMVEASAEARAGAFAGGTSGKGWGVQ